MPATKGYHFLFYSLPNVWHVYIHVEVDTYKLSKQLFSDNLLWNPCAYI